MATYRGTGQDDTIDRSGDTAGDNFLLFQGGSDTVTGGSGNDIFRMGDALNAGDRLDGGAGKDFIVLNGDYSAGVVFNADTIANIEVMGLAAGHSYNLTLADGNVAAGAELLVKAGGLGAGNSVTFNGSAETNGKYYIIAGAGNDTLSGGAKHDVFDLSHGGNDTAHGGGGNDTFLLGGALTAADIIDGGAGNDTLELNGTYNYTFGASQLAGIETLKLDAGHNYSLTWNDTDLASGQTLTVDFSTLTTGGVTFNGIAEQDGNFHFIIGDVGGATLNGGAGNDIFDLTHAPDINATLDGRGGDDTFLFGADYNVNNLVTPLDGGAGNDTVELNGDYSSIEFSTEIASIETFRFDAGHSYGNVHIGEAFDPPAVVTVDASQVSTLFHLTYDTSAYIVEVGSGGMSASAINGIVGNDTFIVTSEAALAASSLDAGGGTDTLVLNGNFDAGFTLGATIVNFENITVEDGHTYSFDTVDANVAAGATMTVDASALTGTNALFFSGFNETDGHFAFIAGAGADSLQGGQLSDTFDLSRANGAFAYGVAGNDTFTVISPTNLQDVFMDAGSGSDTLVLNGDFSTLTAVTAANAQNMEHLTLEGAANSYNLALGGGALEGGGPFTIDASTAAAAAIDLSGAGTKTYAVTGSGGDDTFTFGTNFSTSDTINGGGGSDTLELNGDYSAGLTFGASAMTNVETLKLDDGHSYKLTMNDGNVASGATLNVDASALTGSNALTFDGSAETNGFYNITGGAGDDTVTYGSHFPVNDFFNGGAGDNTLVLNGDFSAHTDITASNVENIHTLMLLGGTNSYNLSFSDNIATNVNVDASAAASLTFDGSGANTTSFGFVGSAGDDHIIGGNGVFDIFIGSLGQDTLTGGGGEDDFTYSDASQSTTASLDTITDYTVGTDIFQLSFFSGTSFQGEFNSAAATGTLDGDLAAAFNSHGGGASSGYVFDFTGADFTGESFLVVDSNGNGQYDAGVDFVVDITGHTGTVSSGDFF